MQDRCMPREVQCSPQLQFDVTGSAELCDNLFRASAPGFSFATGLAGGGWRRGGRSLEMHEAVQ